MAKHKEDTQHILHGSPWPIVGSLALFFIAIGVVNWVHGNTIMGPGCFILGSLIFVCMLFGWFGDVIRESEAGWYENKSTLGAFRWAMLWFIFSEVAFFGSFFAAFFYARLITIPHLGGVHGDPITHYILWPAFQAQWPAFHLPDASQFTGPKGVTDPWGIPALNTLILMVSDAVITWGYWELLRKNRTRLIAAQIVTLILSVVFLILQITEYGNAYTREGLKLNSGIYGNTFYMLTGVHGTHVFVGIIILAVMMFRTIRGDFNSKHNFGIAALTWYWHFIDLLWLILFIFVYWW